MTTPPNPHEPPGPGLSGQNPHGYPQYGQPPHGQPAYGHPQQPVAPYYGSPPGMYAPPRPPRVRQPDSQPGRFTWWDLGAAIFYVLTFFGGLIGVLVFLPEINALVTSGDPEDMAQADFLLNAAGYSVMALICLILSGPALWRSLKTFGHLWWLKLLMIPGGWLGILIVNAVLVSLITDAPETSANQQAIEQMLGAVPLLGALIVLGLLGPYVEEFFFRHLLIGKLSRHINIWVCGAISVLLFPMIHFIPALIGISDDLSLVTFIPYVTMGAAFTLVYILAGRSLLYAWMLHAANNCMAVLLQYFLLPLLPDLEELEPLGSHSLLLLAGMIGA